MQPVTGEVARPANGYMEQQALDGAVQAKLAAALAGSATRFFVGVRGSGQNRSGKISVQIKADPDRCQLAAEWPLLAERVLLRGWHAWRAQHIVVSGTYTYDSMRVATYNPMHAAYHDRIIDISTALKALLDTFPEQPLYVDNMYEHMRAYRMRMLGRRRELREKMVDCKGEEEFLDVCEDLKDVPFAIATVRQQTMTMETSDGTLDIRSTTGEPGLERDKKEARQEGGARGKGGKAKDGESTDIREALVTVQKLVLRNSQENRDMMNGIFDFWLVPGSSAMVTAGADTGLDYNNTVKRLGKGHGQGPPHVHIAMAVVEKAVEVLDEQDKWQAESKLLLKEWVGAASGEHGQRLVDATFSMFRIKKAYQRESDLEEMYKVMFGIRPLVDFKTALRLAEAPSEVIAQVRQFQPALLREALNHAWFLQKGVMPMGAGPKTELERAVEAQLKQLIKQGTLKRIRFNLTIYDEMPPLAATARLPERQQADDSHIEDFLAAAARPKFHMLLGATPGGGGRLLSSDFPKEPWLDALRLDFGAAAEAPLPARGRGSARPGGGVRIFVHEVPGCAGEAVLQEFLAAGGFGWPQALRLHAEHAAAVHRAAKLDSGAVVADEAEATVFYIPAFFGLLVERFLDTQDTAHLNCISETWHGLPERIFLRNAGYDHFISAGTCHPYSICGTMECDVTVYHPFAGNVMVLAGGVRDLGHPDFAFEPAAMYRLLRFITVPFPVALDCQRLADLADASHERPVAVAFLGSENWSGFGLRTDSARRPAGTAWPRELPVSGPLASENSRARRIFREMYADERWGAHGDPRVDIRILPDGGSGEAARAAALGAGGNGTGSGSSDGAIGDLYARSQFCLVLPGHIYDLGRRAYDAMSRGCLPVIVAVTPMHVSVPFAWQLPWHELAVFATVETPEDAARVVRALVAATESEEGRARISERRAALVGHAPELFWAPAGRPTRTARPARRRRRLASCASWRS
ncbi:unnamed protein product, partial [Prorocentrum cordatum]